MAPINGWRKDKEWQEKTLWDIRQWGRPLKSKLVKMHSGLTEDGKKKKGLIQFASLFLTYKSQMLSGPTDDENGKIKRELGREIRYWKDFHWEILEKFKFKKGLEDVVVPSGPTDDKKERDWEK